MCELMSGRSLDHGLSNVETIGPLSIIGKKLYNALHSMGSYDYFSVVSLLTDVLFLTDDLFHMNS